MKSVTIYTIVHTAVDSDRGIFQNPDARGSYLSQAFAHEELERLIAEERAALDERYNCEERDADHWELYQDGYGAACFSRFEILKTELCLEGGCQAGYDAGGEYHGHTDA